MTLSFSEYPSPLKFCICLPHAGKEWTLDADFGSAPPETGAAYLGMLAADALLAVVAAVEKLTDVAVEGCAPSPDRSGGPLGRPAGREGGPGLARDPVDASVCAVLAGGVWPRVLAALGALLARSSSEALTLQLLKVGVWPGPPKDIRTLH